MWMKLYQNFEYHSILNVLIYNYRYKSLYSGRGAYSFLPQSIIPYYIFLDIYLQLLQDAVDVVVKELKYLSSVEAKSYINIM